MKKKINYLLMLFLAITIFSSFMVKKDLSKSATVEKSKEASPSSCTGIIRYDGSAIGQTLVSVNTVPASGAAVQLQCSGTFTKLSGNGTLSVINSSSFAVNGQTGQTITVRINSSPSGRTVTFNFQ